MRRRLPKRDASAGSATVEFAIIAPVLVFAVLATADVGFAIHESFEMDQALRNGAQVALADPGEAQVEAVLTAVDDTGGGRFSTTWAVSRYCACPESPGTSTGCSTTCIGARPTAIFYSIAGKRTYSGIFLPIGDLTRSAAVQVR